MRKYILLVLLLLLATLMFGCGSGSKVSSSTDLVYDPEKIDHVSIQTTSNSITETMEITNKEKVRDIVSLVSNIEVSELSAKEEKELFKDGEGWEKSVELIISLNSNEDKDNSLQAIKGLVTILTDGNLMFSDPKTFEGTQRTISYITSEKQTLIINEMLSVIKE